MLINSHQLDQVKITYLVLDGINRLCIGPIACGMVLQFKLSNFLILSCQEGVGCWGHVPRICLKINFWSAVYRSLVRQAHLVKMCIRIPKLTIALPAAYPFLQLEILAFLSVAADSKCFGPIQLAKMWLESALLRRFILPVRYPFPFNLHHTNTFTQAWAGVTETSLPRGSSSHYVMPPVCLSWRGLWPVCWDGWVGVGSRGRSGCLGQEIWTRRGPYH